jgi:hypothetical protein
LVNLDSSELGDAVISSGTAFDYWGGSDADRKALMAKKRYSHNPSGKFERPAFLIQNGKPTYFYGVGDVNINGAGLRKFMRYEL